MSSGPNWLQRKQFENPIESFEVNTWYPCGKYLERRFLLENLKWFLWSTTFFQKTLITQAVNIHKIHLLLGQHLDNSTECGDIFVTWYTQSCQNWSDVIIYKTFPGHAVQNAGCEICMKWCGNKSGALHWRHNGRHSVSHHQPHDFLLNRLFRCWQIKENIKARPHWPLCGEFTGDRWIPRTSGQLRGKFFHLMTSSWSSLPERLDWSVITSPHITWV